MGAARVLAIAPDVPPKMKSFNTLYPDLSPDFAELFDKEAPGDMSIQLKYLILFWKSIEKFIFT